MQGRAWRRAVSLAAMVAVCGLSACGGGVPLNPVEGGAVEADTMRLASLDQASLTPVAMAGTRLTVRPAEAYAILGRLQQAAVPFCGQSGNDCRVRLQVTSSRVPNASMSQTGQMVVTAGLVRTLRYEDELAFAMAHELAHRVAGHGDARATRQAVGKAVGYVAGLGLMAVTALSGVPVEQGTAREMGRATDRLGRLGGEAGSLVYSQREELEADKLGLQIMNAAGYDPAAAIRVLELLSLATGGTEDESRFFGDHPGFGERIAHLRAEIAALPPRAPSLLAADARVVRPAVSPALMVWGQDLTPLN